MKKTLLTIFIILFLNNSYAKEVEIIKENIGNGLEVINQMVRKLPIENHDEKMDIILTDKKIYR